VVYARLAYSLLYILAMRLTVTLAAKLFKVLMAIIAIFNLEI